MGRGGARGGRRPLTSSTLNIGAVAGCMLAFSPGASWSSMGACPAAGPASTTRQHLCHGMSKCQLTSGRAAVVGANWPTL